MLLALAAKAACLVGFLRGSYEPMMEPFTLLVVRTQPSRTGRPSAWVFSGQDSPWSEVVVFRCAFWMAEL